MRIALIAGASGLVGGELLRALLAAPEYDQVIALGRQLLDCEHPKLRSVKVNFTALDQAVGELGCTDAFCCLGTTSKQAGSPEAFRAVDQTAVLAFAWLAQRHGAKGFFVVSSLGAHAQSRVFYSRVKGEMESALAVLGFNYLGIFQPSLLLGPRVPPRFGEKAWAFVLGLAAPLLWGPLRKYRAIPAAVVARAMLRCALGQRGAGVKIFPSDQIQELGAPGGAAA
ncbi:MAG: oxidoreductase [Lacunisphaera sp.]|nr:oxidoreductase [Lacunisphaera sp.]